METRGFRHEYDSIEANIREVPPSPSIRQMQTWRFLMARGFVMDSMTFDPTTKEIHYSREGYEWVITHEGEIYRLIPAQREFVSDWREEGFLAGLRRTS